MIIKKIRSAIDGNPSEVLKLKLSRVLNNFKSKKIYFTKSKYKEIPIIINNRNQYTFLKEQINWFEKNNYNNLIIIDNQSTYLPLIDFYNKSKYKILRNQKNLGYLSLWRTSFYESIKNSHYVYTDPDILPINECPSNFLLYFLDCLNMDKKLEKIGFGLKIDDINHEDKNFIIKNESKFWQKKILKNNIYYAPIDTTFALYKPFSFGGYWLNAGRTNYPYLARHLPWYKNMNTDENKFYSDNSNYKSSFYHNSRGKNYL